MKTIISNSNINDFKSSRHLQFITDETNPNKIIDLIILYLKNSSYQKSIIEGEFQPTKISKITIDEYKFTSYDYIITIDGFIYHYECISLDEFNLSDFNIV